MERSYRRPRISLGSWLSTFQTLLRGSCEVYWAMTLRSFLIKTFNCSWHRSSGFCRLYWELTEQCTTHPTESRVWKGSWLHGGWLRYMQGRNKEQKGKRKYHAGTPHPNDCGGFPQRFGSCSLMTTLYCTWYDRRSGRRSPLLHWAGRRWVRTLKRRFGISRWRLPLDEPFSADHVQAKAGARSNFWDFFLATEQEEFFLKRPRFWNHFGSFFWAGNSTR